MLARKLPDRDTLTNSHHQACVFLSSPLGMGDCVGPEAGPGGRPRPWPSADPVCQPVTAERFQHHARLSGLTCGGPRTWPVAHERGPPAALPSSQPPSPRAMAGVPQHQGPGGLAVSAKGVNVATEVLGLCWRRWTCRGPCGLAASGLQTPGCGVSDLGVQRTGPLFAFGLRTDWPASDVPCWPLPSSPDS